ncbi:uncharacterized protein [Parasteatoda tepidariorum]|uniref:uncharacterized protein n=1 Tax=Parasteatoda tepidariorum TaxID=114398 RepID=UPI001C729A5B|nr:uncharacterized protein LOC122269960 [Parasteatoda tepidariorum]
MAEDVEISLYKLLISNKFSLQVEESTLPDNVGFTIGIGPVCKGGKNYSRDAFCKKLDYRYQRLLQWWVDIALLERVVPDILAVRCVTHRQHLVGKNISDRLRQSLQYAISAVNKIHSNALYD